MKARKRFMAVLLAFMMVVTYMPALAFAEEVPDSESPVETEEQISDEESQNPQAEEETIDSDENAEEEASTPLLVEDSSNSTVSNTPALGVEKEGKTLSIINLITPDADGENESRALYGYVGEKELINFPKIGDTLEVEIEGEETTDQIDYVAKEVNGQIRFVSKAEGAEDYYVAEGFETAIDDYTVSGNMVFSYFENSAGSAVSEDTYEIGYTSLQIRPDASSLSFLPAKTMIDGQWGPVELYGYIGSGRIKNLTEFGSSIITGEGSYVGNYTPAGETETFGMPEDRHFIVDKIVDKMDGDGVIQEGTRDYTLYLKFVDESGSIYDKDVNGNNYTVTVSAKGIKAPPEKIDKIILAEKMMVEGDDGLIEIDRGELKGYVGEYDLHNFPVEGDEIIAGGESYIAQTVQDDGESSIEFISEDGDSFYLDWTQEPLGEGANEVTVLFAYVDELGNETEKEYEYTLTNVYGVADAEKIEYIPVEGKGSSVTLYEGIDGWLEDYGVETPYYYYELDDIFPRKGDRIILDYGDGEVAHYTSKIVDYEEGDPVLQFVNDADETDYLSASFTSDQSEENAWKPGKNHVGKIYSHGVFCEIPIKIEACPIRAVEFEPASETVSLSDTVNSNGDWYFANPWYRGAYNSWYIENDKFTFTYSEESGLGDSLTHKEAYVAKPYPEGDGVAFLNEDEEGMPFYAYPQLDNDVPPELNGVLLKGKNTFKIDFDLDDYVGEPVTYTFNLTVEDDIEGEWNSPQYVWSDDYSKCTAYSFKAMHGKMNLPSCGKEYFLQPVSRFFFVR